LVGVAVNVTGVPAQIVELDATITTETTGELFMVIVMVFEVTVNGAAQGELEVSITVTISLLFNVEDVNVGEFVPAFTPFTCH
jgi:hypothetical protein